MSGEAPPLPPDDEQDPLYKEPPNSAGYGEEAPAPDHVTLSISPLHLLIPMLEVQAEVRLASFLGLGIIGGYGRISADTTGGDTLHFDAWEIGGQAVYYPSGDFRAWQLGAEVMYLRVNLQDKINNQRVTGVGAGLAIGPLLGYKWIADMGFTLFLQGGFSVMVVKANAKNSLGQSATTKENNLLLLLNVNLGWTF